MLCTGKPFRFDRTADGTDVDGAQAAGELGDAQHVAVDDLLRLMRAEPAVAVEEAIAACERDASLADSWVRTSILSRRTPCLATWPKCKPKEPSC